VSEQDVHCALLSGDPQDQLVIAYNLVIDNRRIADETAKLQIRDFYLASSPPSESQLAVCKCYFGDFSVDVDSYKTELQLNLKMSVLVMFL